MHMSKTHVNNCRMTIMPTTTARPSCLRLPNQDDTLLIKPVTDKTALDATLVSYVFLQIATHLLEVNSPLWMSPAETKKEMITVPLFLKNLKCRRPPPCRKLPRSPAEVYSNPLLAMLALTSTLPCFIVIYKCCIPP